MKIDSRIRTRIENEIKDLQAKEDIARIDVIEKSAQADAMHIQRLNLSNMLTDLEELPAKSTDAA